MAKAKAGKDHDDIFDNLKAAVVETAMAKHEWEDKAAEMLRVIFLDGLLCYKFQTILAGDPAELRARRQRGFPGGQPGPPPRGHCPHHGANIRLRRVHTGEVT